MTARHRSQLEIIAAGLLASALAACHPGGGDAPEAAAAAREAALAPREVRLITPEPREERPSIQLVGEVRAFDSVAVSPEVAGKVDAVRVEVGDRVRSGQPLAEIDRATYKIYLDQAEAQLQAAQADLELFAAAPVAVLDPAGGGWLKPGPALYLAKQIGDVGQLFYLGRWAGKPTPAAGRVRVEPCLFASWTPHDCFLLARGSRVVPVVQFSRAICGRVAAPIIAHSNSVVNHLRTPLRKAGWSPPTRPAPGLGLSLAGATRARQRADCGSRQRLTVE